VSVSQARQMLLLLLLWAHHHQVPVLSDNQHYLTLMSPVVMSVTVTSWRQLTSPAHLNTYVIAVAGRKMHSLSISPICAHVNLLLHWSAKLRVFSLTSCIFYISETYLFENFWPVMEYPVRLAACYTR